MSYWSPKEYAGRPHSPGFQSPTPAHLLIAGRACTQVVAALGEPGRRHVPFRATALTRALRGALGGACRTTLVVCVWDSPAHVAETLATCRLQPRQHLFPDMDRVGHLSGSQLA